MSSFRQGSTPRPGNLSSASGVGFSVMSSKIPNTSSLHCLLFFLLSTASMRCAQVMGSPQLSSVPGGAAQPVATMPVRRV